jgi:hypothetical protein
MTPPEASALRQTSRLSACFLPTSTSRNAMRRADRPRSSTSSRRLWSPGRGFVVSHSSLHPLIPSHHAHQPHPDNPHARPEALREHNTCTRALCCDGIRPDTARTASAARLYVTNTILGRVAHCHGGVGHPPWLLARGLNIADSTLFYTARFRTEESAPGSIYNSFSSY